MIRYRVVNNENETLHTVFTLAEAQSIVAALDAIGPLDIDGNLLYPSAIVEIDLPDNRW